MAMEPGFIWIVALAIAFTVIRSRLEAQFHSDEEEDEERMQLRLDQIKTAMAVADKVLGERMPYYEKLSEAGKKKFRSRVQMVLATKKFYGRQGLKLTPEVELLAAGALVQVTFGLKSFRLPRFDKIVIYPDVFYNRLLDRNLKGSTSPSGVLRFSWKHLAHGFEVTDDNINLGLHEVAHALKVIIDEENDYLDTHLDRVLADFTESGEPMRSAILEGKLTVIRKYASTNDHEFFACCVEYFFESPHHFKAHLPDLYHTMCRMLCQDPANEDYDYAFDLEEQEVKGRGGRLLFEAPQSMAENDEFKWVQWILSTGILIGAPVTVFLHLSLESSVTAIVLFHASVLAIGVVLFRRKLFLSGYTNLFTFVLFLGLGWLPMVAGGGLLLNRFVPVYSYALEDPIEHVKVHGGRYYVYAEQSSIRNLRNGLEIEPYLVNKAMGSDTKLIIEAQMHYGVLGLKVFDDFSVRVESTLPKVE